MKGIEHELIVRVNRLEKAVLTMAWWLVQCQTGFGVQDAKGIEKIIEDGSEATDAQ